MVAELVPIPTSKARITLADAEAIATKVVKYRQNESEACLRLGIKPARWFDWKLRNKHTPQYSEVIDRVRAAQLENCIETIDKCGSSRTIVTRKGDSVQVDGDWRAKAWIAERVLAPERLGDRQQQPQAAPTAININLISTTLEKVYAQVIAQQPVRQITQVSTNDTQLNDSTASG